MARFDKHAPGLRFALIAVTAAFVLPPQAWSQSPPARCEGQGDLQSVSLTTWESGLGSWTTGTHDVFNPDTFDTPDWEVVGNLPDSQAGSAAFVPNLNIGDCAADDESGALTLDSPAIAIPADVEVPRVSVEHWFETEFGWDGGNVKISVNGGPFVLVPASAFEFGEYNETLFPPLDEFEIELNTNPLAGEEAFTGTHDSGVSGDWIESRINLLGIAEGGDTVRLRFDFGVDACDGAEGWYVDDVEIYSCAAEVPPSDCGNAVLDSGEQCDDGNTSIGDGCSNTCQVESGWQCTDPDPPADIADPSFEAGTPNPSWEEQSNNPLGTPICDLDTCGTGGGSGPSDGDFWAWFGGVSSGQAEGSLSQSVVIPGGATNLTFDLEIPACDSSADYVEVLVDGNREWVVNGTSNLCGDNGYTRQSVDVGNYADGGNHELQFHSETFANNDGVSNFFIDLVRISGSPSVCTQTQEGPSLTLAKQVINNNGGNASPSDWTLQANGPTSFSGPGPSVSSGPGFQAGTYTLSEAGGPDGYTASDWDCAGGTQNDSDTITLDSDDSVTCTITNDDIETALTLIKQVVNDDGGTAQPADWTLRATGPTIFAGSGPTVSSGPSFGPGVYSLSESDGPAGYIASAWVCEGGTQHDADTIQLAQGESATCTITNDDPQAGFFINAGLNDAWFNPATGGQGFFITVFPDIGKLFLAWFTYDTERPDENLMAMLGDPAHRWLTAFGDFAGHQAVLDIEITEGGVFDMPEPMPEQSLDGTIVLEFSSCTAGTVTYDIPSLGLQGTVPIQRIALDNLPYCEELVAQP